VSTPAEKYVTHWDGDANPHWVTRLDNGKYQSYHYVKEAADQNTAHLNELVKLRAACAEMAAKIMSLQASEHALQSENAALRQDKERLSWLAVSDVWFDYPADESFTPETFRAAIDVYMAKQSGNCHGFLDSSNGGST